MLKLFVERSSRRWILLVWLMSLISGSHAIAWGPLINLQRFGRQMSHFIPVIATTQADSEEFATMSTKELEASMVTHISANFTFYPVGYAIQYGASGILSHLNVGGNAAKTVRTCARFIIPTIDFKFCASFGSYNYAEFLQNAFSASREVLNSHNFSPTTIVIHVELEYANDLGLPSDLNFVVMAMFDERTHLVDKLIWWEGYAGTEAAKTMTTVERECQLMWKRCGVPYYNSIDDCVEEWGRLPLMGSKACGKWEGNSLMCRSWHSLKAKGDPYTHCPHAGPPGSIDPKGKRKCENDVCDDFSSAWTDERFVWHPIIEKIRVLP